MPGGSKSKKVLGTVNATTRVTRDNIDAFRERSDVLYESSYGDTYTSTEEEEAIVRRTNSSKDTRLERGYNMTCSLETINILQGDIHFTG